MRVRVVVALALLAACSKEPARHPPAASTQCTEIDAMVAKSDALARVGYVDRAAAVLRDAWNRGARGCAEPVAERLAKHLEELGDDTELATLAVSADPKPRALFDTAAKRARDIHAIAPQPDALVEMAEVASREGNVEVSRRLRDRALHRLEAIHRARARLAPFRQASSRMSFSGLGRWLFADGRMVDTRSGRAIAQPGTNVVFDREESFAVVLDKDAPTIVVRDLAATSARSIALNGKAAGDIVFLPKGRRIATWLTRSSAATEEHVATVVDVDDERRSWELSAPAPANGHWAHDEDGHFLFWHDQKSLFGLELATKVLKSWALEGYGRVDTFSKYVAVHTEQDRDRQLLIVRLSDFAEVLRVPAHTWVMADEQDRAVVWNSGRAITIHDLDKGSSKTLTLKNDCHDFISLTKQTLKGGSCQVDLTTGMVTTSPPVRFVSAAGEDLPSRMVPDSPGMKCERAGGLDCEAFFEGYGLPLRVGSAGPEAYLIQLPEGIGLMDAKSGRVKTTLAESAYVDLQSAESVTVRPDQIIVRDTTGRIRSWNETGTIMWREPARAEPVVRAAFAVDGDLLTVSRIGTVRRFHTSRGRLDLTWQAPRCVEALALAAADKPIVVCRIKDGLVVFATGVDAPLTILPEHELIALDAKGQTLLTRARSAQAGEVHVTTLSSPVVTKTMKLPGLPYNAQYQTHLAGDLVAYVDVGDGIVWNLRTDKSVAKVAHVRGAIALAADGSAAAFAKDDGGAEAVRLDSTAKPDVVRLVGADLTKATSLVVGKTGVIAVSEGEQLAWGWEDSSSPRKAKASVNHVLALSPDGLTVAFGGRTAADAGITLASVPSLEPQRVLLALPSSSVGLTLARDEPPIMTGDVNEAMKLGRCAIGPRLLPLEVCLGRFARP